MKFFTVVLIVAFAAVALAELTEEQKEKIRKLSKECEEESHVDHELLKKVKEGVITDDAKLKEHFFCFNKKIGVQDDQGKWNVDKLKERLALRVTAEKAAEAATKCAVEKSTPQESAFEAAKCLHDLAANHHDHH